MRIAYLDCFSGISGDMFLGALLDAGVPFELLQKTVADLNIGAALELSKVMRAGIAASKLDVVVGGQKDLPREEFWATQHRRADHAHYHKPGTDHSHSADQHAHSGDSHSHGSHRGAEHTHGHGHSHSGEHDHSHEHPHEDAPGHNHGHQHGRGLGEILKIIADSSTSERAKQTASEIFLALGAAEAKIHNVGIEGIHFHEVGAADAIIDIVCAAVGAEALGVEQFRSSPLNVGGGTVVCAHGVLPVPAPATLELLRGVPIYSGEIQKELVTPTGAAIVKVLVSSFGPRPTMTADAVGYGAGARDFSGQANVLRISIGEMQTGDAVAFNESLAAEEEIAILEANLDDLNPQVIGYIVDLAFAAGALDVFTMPVQMKKNRPGTVLTILAKPEQEEQLRGLLFRESTTLGIRSRREKRWALPRHYEMVTTPWGNIRIKIGNLGGAPSHYAPEYEDCRRIATEQQVPLKDVMQEAIRLYLDRKHG